VTTLAPAELVPADDLPPTGRSSATWRTVRRLRRNRIAMAALAFIVLVALVAVFGPWLVTKDPNRTSVANRNAGPSAEFWLGSDDLGRDTFTRLVHATRLSMRTGLQAVALAVGIAIPLGVIAGYFRRWPDAVLMRIADGVGAFPPVLLALAIAAMLGPGSANLSLAVAVVFLPGMMRLSRGQVLAVREEVYVEASRSLGSPHRRIVLSHVLPNIAPAVIIQVTMSFGFVLVTESGLSYLGLGDPPPAASWGSMLQQGFTSYTQGLSALLVLWPALAITLTVLAFQILGDGLRDALGREMVRTRAPRRRSVTSARSTQPAPPIPEPGDPEPLLAVEGLAVEFATPRGWVRVVDDVSFSVESGRTVGLVGESGSGKTVSVLAVMGLLPEGRARIVGGSVRLEGRELVGLAPRARRRLQGSEMAMVFQEPMSSLNPAFTVGNQIIEAVRAHRDVSREAARARAIEVLDLVGIPDAAGRLRDYPHQFSGGMRQRVMIAMALACEPKLLVADEPTTALDVTIQAQILDLLRSLQHELGMAVVFVTHDLGVVADVCDEVAVLYAGQVVERRSVDELFGRPLHPYTQGLLDSMPQATAVGAELVVIPGQVPLPESMPAGCRFHPRCSHAESACTTDEVGVEEALPSGDGALVRCRRAKELVLGGARIADPADAVAQAAAGGEPVVTVADLRVHFPVRSKVLRRTVGRLQAVDGVGFEIGPAETLGLVGESGSGKSTTGRAVLRLLEPDTGQITVDGNEVTALSGEALRRARTGMQMVFQDPYSSLDPRRTVVETVGEPLEVHRGLRGSERDREVARLLDLVGIGGHALGRYPYEFSGGQRQRIAIARALALEPRFVVCDEPVSSLDVSTQSQVVNLLAELQRELGIAYLFIAHDLSVVAHISHRIAVMYLGRIVESGPTAEIVTRPRHPYTEALLSAVPVPDPRLQRSRRRIVLGGDIPSPTDPPPGCPFHTRCPAVMDLCRTVRPPETTVGAVTVACHLHTPPTTGG
jgi:oligopeptide/dipeptide ABC transporter ATP-binding protein